MVAIACSTNGIIADGVVSVQTSLPGVVSIQSSPGTLPVAMPVIAMLGVPAIAAV